MRTRARRDRVTEAQAHMGKKRKSSIKDTKHPNADGERRPPVLESKDLDSVFTTVSSLLLRVRALQVHVWRRPHSGPYMLPTRPHGAEAA